jgi:hypothetical protein
MSSRAPQLALLGLAVFSASSCKGERDSLPNASAVVETCPTEAAWGEFGPYPLLRDIGNGDIFLLDAPFTFRDRNGKVWTARKDLRWDGASIPRALWTAVGSPMTGCYRWASMVHDECYKHADEYIGRSVTRKDADRMFHDGCRAKGIGRAKSATMYYALRWFGKRWSDAEPANTEDLTEQQIQELLAALERDLETNPSYAASDDALLEDLESRPPTALRQQFGLGN